MDWNKINTILITAFIILNIFLFVSSYNDIFSDEYNVTADKAFTEDVKNILKEKNIAVNCELPEETYMLHVLDTEYEIINIDKVLLSRFLGSGPEPAEDVTLYQNENGEILEITDGKKLHYTLREKISGKLSTEDTITKDINKFIESKRIDASGYSEDYRNISDDGALVVYTKKYNNFSIDNSYMYFYFDKEGIYKLEMQNIISVKESAEKVRTFSAAEALPSLLSHNDVENKEIIGIEMTYYSVEDENWKFISGISSYPVWKVIFSDGTQKHLSVINIYETYKID
ncbi:MAG TPA: hypothetical protein DCM73_10795 [Clostridiales bacterium]|nr:hypothetical protein [Clostridiales bacterium]